MITVKHYSHNFDSENPFPLVDDFGDSNTDLTKWRPDISVARAQAGIASGKKFLYDFPDGKDNGETIQTFIRSKGLDVTEIETAEKRITQIIEDKKKDGLEKLKSEKEKKDFLDNIKKMADSGQNNQDNANSELNSAK